MINRVREISMVAAMIAATPALASAHVVAYNTAPPVSVTNFSVNESFAPGVIGGDATQASLPVANEITVTFVNEGAVPATTVKFLVSNGGYLETIVDKGTFTPGIGIKHVFDAAVELGEGLTTKCEIAEVDFADGTSWHPAGSDETR